MTHTIEELRGSLAHAEQEMVSMREELLDKDKQLADTNEKLADESVRLASTQEMVNRLQSLINPDGNPVASWRVTLVNNLGLVITGVIVLVVVGAIIAFFYDSGNGGSGGGALIKQLADPGAARGLITFLIVVGTVVMGLVLLISSFRTAEGTAESFTRGKEIFTILVGILGTIVGFYFGVGGDDSQVNDLNPGVVEQQSISDVADQKPGDDAATTEVGGGAEG